MKGKVMGHPIEFKGIWKKFKKGDKVYALRDVIPQLIKNSLGTAKTQDLPDGLMNNEFWAVRDVDFHVKQGEVLGIIGANGAGKSTILKLLSRLMAPDRGEISIQGRLSALIEVTAGFHPEFTGRENIYFNGAILGMSKEEIDKKFDQIVEFSGVSEFLDTPVKRYSSGMSARLGFAVAAHVDPDVLLVDEVLSVGDMTFQARCTDKMRELIKSGTTIIFISHNIPLVQSLCERIILLDHGIVLKEGDPEDVVPHYEEIVYRGRQEEVKKQLATTSREDMLSKQASLVKIDRIQALDKDNREASMVKIGETLRIDVDYHSEVASGDYVFSYEIVRADGTSSCTSNTKRDKITVPSGQGNNRLSVEIERLRLTPGVYFVKVSVWDKDMIHPYVTKKEGMFSVPLSGAIGRYMGAAYLQDSKWMTRKI
jgi:lipopolysaccharide transport system ATP-binding protein